VKNQNGKIKARAKKPLSWNYYDRLPPELKKLLQDAPYPLQLSGVRNRIKKYGVEAYVKIVKKKIDEITKKSCAATYGPDHPQSR
jgi:hypothetical protein